MPLGAAPIAAKRPTWRCLTQTCWRSIQVGAALLSEQHLLFAEA